MAVEGVISAEGAGLYDGVEGVRNGNGEGFFETCLVMIGGTNGYCMNRLGLKIEGYCGRKGSILI